MDKDSRLYKWALKQQKKMEISEGMSTGFKHRSAYHREFFGYSEIRTPAENGKFKIERVYVAPWYKHNISDRNWLLLKIADGAGCAAAIALFIIASLQNTVWNYSRVTGALQGLTAIALTVLMVRIIFFLASPRKMTTAQCNNTDTFMTRWTLVASLACSACLIWNIILIIFVTHFQYFSRDFITLCLLIPAALILFSLWFIQKKLIFIPVENTNSVAEEKESYVIR